ncbi:proline-rich transmembrane protein 1-like [Ruditapes philippinarum]|uniref:proline-rich transmembrane protein 1-like n=1 Tax=Ruditapes philippinarum TaxID=129788 RepID=UPI00295C2B90|nr:proline-rich transmembrane protein 1-like [Ruditapes philippinarum]
MMDAENKGYDQGPPPGYNQGQPAGGYQGQPTGGYQGQPGYGQPPATVVVTTQPVAGVVTVGTRPPDYLIPSILACLCCFWPTGIFAIYYALRTNTLVGEGNQTGAFAAAKTAKTLTIVSVIVGLVWILICIIVTATSGGSRTSY